MSKTTENPNGTTRKTVRNQNYILDGNQIRTYTRSRMNNELSGPKVETFNSVKKAQREFDRKR